MANPHWFDADPKLAWAFYGHRKNLYKATEPHRGFQIMLNWARREKKHAYFVFTSNVDGHFQKAGFNEDAVYEVHGSINHFPCTKGLFLRIFGAAYDCGTIPISDMEELFPRAAKSPFGLKIAPKFGGGN